METCMIITITNSMEIINTQKKEEKLSSGKEASLPSIAQWLVEKSTGSVASEHAQLGLRQKVVKCCSRQMVTIIL